MARRATDFRLDAQLRELCAADIDAVCGYEKDSLDSVAGHDGRVVECLQDYKAELKSAACRDRVHVLTARAAADIRMDRPLADACSAAAARLCADVEPGGARVFAWQVHVSLPVAQEPPTVLAFAATSLPTSIIAGLAVQSVRLEKFAWQVHVSLPVA